MNFFDQLLTREDHRPDPETRDHLWKACKGNPICYILSVLAVTFVVGAMTGLADYTRKHHPTLAHWIFDSSIGLAAALFTTVLICLAVGAGVTALLKLPLKTLKKHHDDQKP